VLSNKPSSCAQIFPTIVIKLNQKGKRQQSYKKKGLAIEMLIMNDAQDPNEYYEDVMGEDVHGGNAETKSNARRA